MLLGKKNEYLPDFVYGGIDGAITTLAIMAGAIGASLSPLVIIILGFANLFADGFSMGVSNYLSTRSENDLATAQDDDSHRPKRASVSAVTTFVAFVLIGFIPLFPFVIAPVAPLVDANTTIFSFGFAVIAFLIVGAIRGHITEKNPYATALTTLLIGGCAAIIAFGVGYLLNQWIGQ